MKQTNYLQAIKSHWLLIVIITAVSLMANVIYLIITPSYYEAKVELLIIQKQSQNIDAYSAQKSAEKLGSNLSNIVYSSDFLNRVLNTGSVDQNLFSEDAVKRKEQWNKMIKASTIAETGIIKIYGYGLDKETAVAIAQAAAQVLEANGAEYQGSSDVVIKKIDEAVVSNWPARPNIILNTVAALVIGFVGSIFLVIFMAEFRNVKTEKEELSYQPLQSEMPKKEVSNEPFPQAPVYSVLDQQNYFQNTSTQEPGLKSEPVSMHDHLPPQN